MAEATSLEQKLKRIRLKIEEGQDAEALAALDALTAQSSKDERDITFTRAWYFAHKAQWNEAVSLLSPYFDPSEIEQNWHAASQRERERRAIYLLWLGNAAVNSSYYEDATHYFSSCLKVLDLRRVHLPAVRVKALYGYAMACIPLGLYPSAIQHYEQALQVCKKEKIEDDLPHIYYGLADAHRLTGHFSEAYSYGKTALKMYQERGDRYHTCRMLNLLGRIAFQMGDYRAASDHYMDSLSIATIEKFSGMQLLNFVAVAELRLEEGRLEEARTYCEHADEICSSVEGDHHICGMMYLVRGKVEQRAASQQERQEACSLLTSALAYFEQARHHLAHTQAHTTLSQLYGHMAEVCEALGRSEEALAHWRLAFAASLVPKE
jgi:tetratricopeptide (TPR) repeat protein